MTWEDGWPVIGAGAGMRLTYEVCMAERGENVREAGPGRAGRAGGILRPFFFSEKTIKKTVLRLILRRVRGIVRLCFILLIESRRAHDRKTKLTCELDAASERAVRAHRRERGPLRVGAGDSGGAGVDLAADVRQTGSGHAVPRRSVRRPPPERVRF